MEFNFNPAKGKAGYITFYRSFNVMSPCHLMDLIHSTWDIDYKFASCVLNFFIKNKYLEVTLGVATSRISGPGPGAKPKILRFPEMFY